jgi:hypothetical protein
MAFTDAGTKDLREYCEGALIYISFQTSGDAEIYRVKTDATNVTMTEDHEDADKRLTYEVTILGSDVETFGGTLPVTITKAKFYKVATAGTAMTDDSDTAVTLSASGDSVVATVKIIIPAV